MKNVSEEGALICLQEIINSPTTASAKNRVAYLCGMIKSFMIRNPTSTTQAQISVHPSSPVTSSSSITGPGPHSIPQMSIKPPDHAKIEELRSRLGFPLEITAGQRHLGPSPDWNGSPPTNEVTYFLCIYLPTKIVCSL